MYVASRERSDLPACAPPLNLQTSFTGRVANGHDHGACWTSRDRQDTDLPNDGSTGELKTRVLLLLYAWGHYTWAFFPGSLARTAYTPNLNRALVPGSTEEARTTLSINETHKAP